MKTLNMYEKRIKLRELLAEKECTPIVGVYDVLSAKIVENTGFPVLYTGSMVSGATQRGLCDVNLVNIHDLLDITREICKRTNVPIIADADDGFYHSANIWRTVNEFEHAGVSGIHIEDNLFGKHSKCEKLLLDVDVMADQVRAAVEAKMDPNFMIIARTDAYLALGDLDDAIMRLNAYLDAGADAVYLTIRDSVNDVLKAREQIKGTLLVGSINYPDSRAVENASGMNGSIYWPQALQSAYSAVKDMATTFMQTQDITKIKDSYKLGDDTVEDLISSKKFEDDVEKYNTIKRFKK